MTYLECPVNGCNYATPSLGQTAAAALLNAHCINHTQTVKPASKPEQAKRPIISPGGTSEDWSYFLDRWNSYKTATGLAGRDQARELLECCEESCTHSKKYHR